MDIHLVLSSMSRSTSRVTDLNVETLQFTAENLIFSHPYLEKLTISLPQTTLFPEKDPQDIELPGSLTRSDEGVEVKIVIFGDAYEDPLDWGEKLRRGPEHFHRIHIHTVYMNILHWVAHRMLRLPSTIKTLFLEGEVHWSIFLFYEDQADEVNYVKKNGRPYSASMAQAVFRTLSKDYPALQSVEFGSSTDNRACFSWFRSDDVTWKYFPPLDYPLSFAGRMVKGHLEYGTNCGRARFESTSNKLWTPLLLRGHHTRSPSTLYRSLSRRDYFGHAAH
ncbi:hypothetical protein CPB84DRAFT_1006646 [Gymnopilus junonius]|uniref:Uncharacterized protein n=1 Tax=Gymnopilus junonius TaxID=109634 RepID=A0A9P5NQR7_GYMJU|nr:hypothetical protein CPB84DRAFT_1006646 [Gymnopilus junonius]